MCYPVECPRCHKTTWDGCGEHAGEAGLGIGRQPLGGFTPGLERSAEFLADRCQLRFAAGSKRLGGALDFAEDDARRGALIAHQLAEQQVVGLDAGQSGRGPLSNESRGPHRCCLPPGPGGPRRLANCRPRRGRLGRNELRLLAD